MEKEKTFLIRDTLADEGYVPSSSSPTYSPDIICYQNSILTYTDACKSYNSYICKSFLQDSVNLVYVRAKNNTGIAQNGEVKAFYSPLTLLYLPDQWKKMYTQDGNEIVELCQAQTVEAEVDAIVLCKNPFLLMNVEDPNLHHCMMALSRTKGEEWLELPEKFDGDVGLWDFLKKHSNIAYNNIVIEQGFYRQHSELVMIGNHNTYSESYTIRVVLEKKEKAQADTFGGCNIGRIQILNTDINCPFDINIYPNPDSSEAFSEPFMLPAGYEKSVIITYFAADSSRKIFGTLQHDYITCDSRNRLPLNGEKNICLKRRDGQAVNVSTEARIGDFAIVFTDNEKDSVKQLNLKPYEIDGRL